MTNGLRDRLLNKLDNARGEKIPSKSASRVGRMAMTVLRGTSMVAFRDKDTELDPEKIVKMVSQMGKLKGIAMKMGQILSYIDVALPDELREALAVLQTNAQPMTYQAAVAVVRASLGDDADALLATMERDPIAAASIGQVHRATIDGETVAVKIQYPEIEKAIMADFHPASAVIPAVAMFFPNGNIDGYVKEARERFLEECNYAHEAHCQSVFAKHYATHPLLHVPEVYSDYCGKQVLTTRFIDGRSFDDFLAGDPSQQTRDKIGEALFEFYMGSLFRHCIYNCDPHPGNYLFTEDGKIAMLDHGCTRQFEPQFVAHMAYLTKAVHADEQEMIHTALLRLKIVRPEKKYNYQLIRGFLRSFFGPMLVDETRAVDLSATMELKEMMKKKQQLMKFALPGEFTFLFRIRFGLMSVLSKLESRANWCALEQQYVAEFETQRPVLMKG